jgi:hypothetical protein
VGGGAHSPNADSKFGLPPGWGDSNKTGLKYEQKELQVHTYRDSE